MLKGYKHTQKTKDKIRLALLGKKGVVHSPETKARISNTMTGRKFTPEHIDGIKRGAKNRKKAPPMSQETKDKIKETKAKNKELGLTKPIMRTEEQRKLMSDNAKKRWQDPVYREKCIASKKLYKPTEETKQKLKNHIVTVESRQKISKYQKGRKKSKEQIEKIKLANTGKKRTPKFKLLISNLKIGVSPTEEAKIAVAKGKEKRWKDRNKRTVPEIKVKELLELNNIIYNEQKRVRYKLYDFYLPDYTLLIEIDGTYWHGKGKKQEQLTYTQTHNRKNDYQKHNLAQNKGYRLLRIWEDELDKLENLIKNNFIGLEYMEINDSNKDNYFENIVYYNNK